MFCSKCGAQIPEGNRFCGRCGARAYPTGPGGRSGPDSHFQNSSYDSDSQNFDDLEDNGTTVIANKQGSGNRSPNGQGSYGNDSFNNRGGYGNGGFNNQGGYGNGGFNNQGGYGNSSFNNQGGYGNGSFNNQGGYGNGSFNNQGGYGNGSYNYQGGYGNDGFNNRSGYEQVNYNYNYEQNQSQSEPGKDSSGRKLRILIGAGALVLTVLLAVLVFRFLLPTVGKKSTYVYLRDDSFEFTQKIGSGDSTELESFEGGSTREDYVKFSEDGKYLYFFTEFDDSEEIGTLNRIACGRLNSDRKKNDKNIEEIDTDVKPDYSILDNGNIIYLNGDDTLYYYDGKDEKKVSNDVTAFYTDGSDRVIYVSEDALYGCDLKDGKTKSEKLESEYEYIIELNDYSLDHFYYVKNDEDGNAVLYSAGVGDESSKVDEYVTILDTGDGFLYSAPNGDTKSLYDLVDDDLDDSDEDAPDKSDLVKDLKDEDNDAPLSNLYFCNGKEIQTVQKDIFSSAFIGNTAVFNTEDTIGDLPKLSEIVSVDQVKMVCALDYSKQNYIASIDERTPVQLSEDAAEKINDAKTSGDFTLYLSGDSLYLNNSAQELLCASADDEKTGKFKDVADDAVLMISSDSDHAYYIADQHKENNVTYADLYECDGDDYDLIAEDIIPEKTEFYEDMTLVRTGSEESGYELSKAEDGKTEVIDKDISQHICIGSSKILYISDNELYLYDDDESESLEKDVDLVWASDGKEPDRTVDYKKQSTDR